LHICRRIRFVAPHLIHPQIHPSTIRNARIVHGETKQIRSRIISIARIGYSHGPRYTLAEAAEDKQSAAWRCILIDAPAAGGSVGGEGGEEEEDDETENRDGGRADGGSAG